MKTSFVLSSVLVCAVSARAQVPDFSPPDGFAVESVRLVVDWDGDGDLDIVERPVDEVRLLVNEGGVGDVFAAPVVVSDELLGTGSGLSARLDAGDVDQDGRVDLVQLNSDELSFKISNVDGTLAPAVFLLDDPPGLELEAMRVADVTGDGVVDVVLVTTPSSGSGASVQLLEGLGAGAFAPLASVATFEGLNPDTLEVGDLDGDGVSDVLVSGPVGGSGNVHVLLGGGGALTFAGSEDVTFGVSVVQLADLDGDGTADLLLTSFLNGASWVRGLGDGTFAAPEEIASQAVLTTFAVADFDDDGADEAIANVFEGFLQETTLLWDGFGGALETFEVDISFSFFPGELVASDFDGLPGVDVLAFLSGSAALHHNFTYPASSPWEHLGGSFSPDDAAPYLYATGSLAADTDVEITVVANDFEGGLPFLVLGASVVDLPFKGGVLVPSPDLVVPLPSGVPELLLGDRVPFGVAPGTEFVVQTWFVNGPLVDVVATSAVRGTTP